MLNICSVNVQDAPAVLRHNYIFDRPISLFQRITVWKNWLRKLGAIALPVYFMVSNFDYGIQLSIIHVSKFCLMPI